MKISPQEREVMDRMQPGALSGDGFLGDDSRSLGEILDADRSEVEALGLTNQILAEHLAAALAEAMPAGGEPVALGEGRRAVYHESMGRIPCPFMHGRVFPKGEVELTAARDVRTIRFTPLSVHLIAEHGFYQGRGSRYRLEPAELARIFGLGRGNEGSG